MARWSVRKRDGVWVVLDRARKLRYAAADHPMALTFALISAVKKPKLGQFIADHTQWHYGGDIRFLYFDADEIKKMIRDAYGDQFDPADENPDA